MYNVLIRGRITMVVKETPQFQFDIDGRQLISPFPQKYATKPDLDLQVVSITPAVRNMLLELKRFTAGLNSYGVYKTADEALGVLSRTCCILQRLLSSSNDRHDHFSESCRLASALFIFIPLRGHFPDPAMLVNSLLLQLKVSLSCLDHSIMDLTLLFWIFVVGGIQAVDTIERRWFMGYIVILMNDLNLDSRSAATAALHEVIWHERFCELPFEILWGEALSMQQNL
jgi:hypothetical protein